ncbi:hypothetical protein DHW03_07180 [Pedobacter yonginense]|uniref:Uncharacterized protein n=1 Tax=Pedobacter yonginense TaxID=651869 RepID=A0A317EKN6_9SPHI|nr:hypothetical protein DHW03_07180 [Pedobacter yonginense]
MKPIFKELLWLFLPLLMIIGGYIWLGELSLEINLFDSYLVISPTPCVFLLYVGMVFVIYLIKETKHHYQRKAQNLITIFSGLILTIICTLINGFIYTFLFNSWTVYPPLSGLNEPPEKIINFHKLIGLTIGVGFQIIIILFLINLAYNWGKAIKKSNG